jgi:hypothetical protein
MRLRRAHALGICIAIIGFSIGAFVAPAAAAGPPVVTGTSPSAGSNTGSVTVSVQGSNFVSGAQVSLKKGTTIIEANGETVNGTTSITNASLNLTGHAPGRYQVLVRNPDNQTGTFGDGTATGFLVVGGQPTVTGSTPSSANSGSTVNVDVNGSNLARGATVEFIDDSPLAADIDVNSVLWLSLTSLRVNITIPATGPVTGVKVGNHSIKVTNTDAKNATCTGCFEVKSATSVGTIAITSFSPPAAPNSGVLSFTIKGPDFPAKENLSGSLELGTTKLPLTISTVEQGTLEDDTITGTVNLNLAAPGSYRLVLARSDTGARGQKANALTVSAVAPVINNVSPNRIAPGADADITINGSGFANGDVVTLEGSTIPVQNVSVHTANQITAVVKAGTARADAYSVVVRHTDSQTGRCSFCLAIIPASPAWLFTDHLGGPANTARTLGLAGDRRLSCDIDNDGRDEPVRFRNGTWYLYLTTSAPNPVTTFSYGAAGDTPVCGDWNHDGLDTVGIRRGNTFYLRNSNSSGGAQIAASFGVTSDVPVVGDWNKDGFDTIGVFRAGKWYLRDANSSGPSQHSFTYGTAGDKPVVGDWDGDNDDTAGVLRGRTWFIATVLGGGSATSFGFGVVGAQPIAGDWNGDHIATVGEIVS